MDTFIVITAVGLVAWDVMLSVRLYRIETYLAESELCDECRTAATGDAESSPNP